MQALILAGSKLDGLGRLTRSLAPPLLLIEREPRLHRIITQLEAAGIREILIVAGECAPEIRSFVCRRGYDSAIATFDFSDGWGTAGAIKPLECLIHSTLLAISTDVIFDFDLRRLVGAHFCSSAALTIACPTDANSVPQDQHRNVPDEIVDAGAYVLEADLIGAIPSNRPYSVIDDLLPRLLNSDAPVHFASMPGRWAQLDSISGYLECQRWFLDSEAPNGFIHPGALVGSRVQLNPPYFIGPGSFIQREARIGPYAVVAGPASIGPRTVIENSVIYPDTKIPGDSEIKGAVMLNGMRIEQSERPSPGLWANRRTPAIYR